MCFAFHVLAAISTRTSDQIETIFKEWFVDKGSRVLQMSDAHSRAAAPGDDSNLDDQGYWKDSLPPHT